MTSVDYSHDGFFGFMNMLKYRIKTHNIHLRPNFPPINPSPTFLEIFKNANRADFGLIASITLAAIPISYLMVNQAFKELTDFSNLKDLYLLKSNCFRFGITTFFLMSIPFAVLNAQWRLIGQVPNGSTWKHALTENRINKEFLN